MSSERSLYERLGGYDGIAAITDDFLGRVMADEKIGYYWAGDSQDTRRRDRQLIVDFLSEASGGPTFYTGRDMKTSHEGLDISQDDWEVFMRHTIEALENVEIHDKEMDDCLAVIENLSADIVEATS